MTTFLTVAFGFMFLMMVMGMWSDELMAIHECLWNWDFIGVIPESDEPVFEVPAFELPNDIELDRVIQFELVFPLIEAEQFITDLKAVDYGAVRNRGYVVMVECDYDTSITQDMGV
jgi:hypothetical protein